MTDEKWATAWEIFRQIQDLPPAQRAGFLAEACADSEIWSEVNALCEVSLSCSISSQTPLVAEAEYLPGAELGRYVIVGTLGAGGFGRIYAARDKELRRVVALKVLSARRTGDSESLLDEARAASALNHPNIVTVYETLTAGEHPAIAMEFVDGQSLRQILREAGGPLPVDRVVGYGKQMAQALAAAHEAGILHRDIKPENILLRKDEYIKLVDFGLATATSSSGAAEPLSGTLRYLSPEQLSREATSSASDVFSLGLVLYEMAAGRHAFSGVTPLEVAGSIATMRPVSLGQKIPAQLDRVILAMLSKGPNERLTARAVAKALEQIASGAERRVERRRWLVFAALAILAGALALIWVQGTRKPPALTVRLDTRPLTGEAGQELNPALSPDGLSMVYGWRESPSGTPATFVREIGSDRRTVLPIAGPYTWLPDGSRIAFLRKASGLDVLCTISRDGTGEQEVLRANDIVHFEWSPGGEWMLYSAKTASANHYAIFLFKTSSRQSSQITFPPATSLGDEYFAISPDGKQLAFRRAVSYGNADLYLTHLPGSGPAKQLTFQRIAGEELAWTRDGSAIIASAGSSHSLWLHPLHSAQTPSRLTEVGMEAVGIRAARGRNRLAWLNRLEDTNIWRVPVTGGKASRVVSSVMRDVDVASSSLGMLAFRSDRSGFPELWIAGKDGEAQKMVTELHSFTGSPHWSPDGRRVTFGSRAGNGEQDVYVMACDAAPMKCGAPVRLTHHAATDTNSNWSADGAWIYFASQRSGEWQVWKTAASGGGEAIQVTTRGGYFAAESSDGRWLYYSRIHSPQVTGVWRKSLDQEQFRADDPGELVLPLQYLATATWVLSGREIFYSTPGAGLFTAEPGQTPMALWAFDLERRQKRMIHRVDDVPLARGLALSADRKWLYFVRLDRSESNVMIADYEVVR